MKRVLNFGSLNIDKVYGLEHFVQPGETIFARSCDTYCGGKGLNQSIALARCGAAVNHAGAVGNDGDILMGLLKENGVDTAFVQQMDCPSGHAIIQVDANGQNSIIVYGGANITIQESFIDKVMDNFDNGDFLLLQNEINNIPYIMTKAKQKGLHIIFNPSPVSDELLRYPLDLVDTFILNEVEGAGLTGEAMPNSILSGLCDKFPHANFVLTLGEKGSVYKSSAQELFQPAFEASVVDTTAAGDTFTGFLIGSITKGLSYSDAMKIASQAAAISVSRTGAAPSIPTIDEVMAKL